MERYGHIVSPNNFKINRSYFEASRFLSLQPEDTFYTDIIAFHQWCPNLCEKITSAKIVGDKRPEYHLVFDKLVENFSPLKLIHIIRDVRDVALSWEVRAKVTKDWPAKRDAIKSVQDWNRSNESAINALNQNLPIMIVSYEKLFSELIDEELNRILKFLELEWKGDDRKKVTQSFLANASRLKAERIKMKKTLLDASLLEKVNEASNLDIYTRLLRYSAV